MLKFTFGEERLEMDATTLWPFIEKHVIDLQQTQPTLMFLVKGFLSTVVFPPLTKAMQRSGSRLAPPNLRSAPAQQNMLLYMVGWMYMFMMAAAEVDTWDILYEIEDRPDGPVTHITGLATTLASVEAALEAVIGSDDIPALPSGGESPDSV